MTDKKITIFFIDVKDGGDSWLAKTLDKRLDELNKAYQGKYCFYHHREGVKSGITKENAAVVINSIQNFLALLSLLCTHPREVPFTIKAMDTSVPLDDGEEDLKFLAEINEYWSTNHISTFNRAMKDLTRIRDRYVGKIHVNGGEKVAYMDIEIDNLTGFIKFRFTTEKEAAEVRFLKYSANDASHEFELRMKEPNYSDTEKLTLAEIFHRTTFNENNVVKFLFSVEKYGHFYSVTNRGITTIVRIYDINRKSAVGWTKEPVVPTGFSFACISTLLGGFRSSRVDRNGILTLNGEARRNFGSYLGAESTGENGLMLMTYAAHLTTLQK